MGQIDRMWRNSMDNNGRNQDYEMLQDLMVYYKPKMMAYLIAQADLDFASALQYHLGQCIHQAIINQQKVSDES